MRVLVLLLLLGACLDPAPVAPRPPVTDEQAREIADRVARDEIARVEADHRARGETDVRLPFDAYKVTLIERSDKLHFLYVFDRANAGFMTWMGHGMHLSVLVDRATGAAEMVPGE
jgi:hypothetical protein